MCGLARVLIRVAREMSESRSKMLNMSARRGCVRSQRVLRMCACLLLLLGHEGAQGRSGVLSRGCSGISHVSECAQTCGLRGQPSGKLTQVFLCLAPH